MPNVLSPRDLVSRPDNMNETVLHTYYVLNSPSFHSPHYFNSPLNKLFRHKTNFS